MVTRFTKQEWQVVKWFEGSIDRLRVLSAALAELPPNTATIEWLASLKRGMQIAGF